MRRAQRLKSDVQLAVRQGDVAGAGESRLDEGASLLFSTAEMGRDEADKLAFGLICDHLEQVGQVFSLHAKLDDFGAVELLDGNTLGNAFALLFEFQDTLETILDAASDRRVGVLEALQGTSGVVVSGEGLGAIRASLQMPKA